MSSIDQSKQFIPLNIAVLTVSDTRSLADDKSGTTLAERLTAAGHKLAAREIVSDDIEAIRGVVKKWIADAGVDVIITTGGTGFTGRDVTPEAIEPLFEKRMDGFSIAFHMQSHAAIQDHCECERSNSETRYTQTSNPKNPRIALAAVARNRAAKITARVPRSPRSGPGQSCGAVRSPRA